MNVEELMNTVKSCRQGDTVRQCATLMRDEEIGFVPICNDSGEPVGAITDRDLAIRVLAEGRTADEAVDRFMTREVVSCRVGDDVDEAERLMREHQKSRIMVCDDGGRVAGIISLADIADVESEESIGETLQQVKSEGQQPTAH
ncbi:MAG TPA: CBS domain-containing protein [Anaeromyxobacteraceae bacterium]|nr:CBS domain-containing protein [Anaeromyxobacteraceae bacterium]